MAPVQSNTSAAATRASSRTSRTPSTLATDSEKISVIDPANRTGKISLPRTKVFPTAALEQLNSSSNLDATLCMLFMKGKCRAGRKCRQIHAERSVVNDLRQAMQNNNSCCHTHGDVRSHEEEWMTLLEKRSGEMFSLVPSGSNTSKQPKQFPLSSLARTVAADRLLCGAGGRSIRVREEKVCRLHQANNCRFGRDCSNFHVCREVMKALTTHSSLTSDTVVPLTSPSPKIKTPLMTNNAARQKPKTTPQLQVPQVMQTPKRGRLEAGTKREVHFSPTGGSLHMQTLRSHEESCCSSGPASPGISDACSIESSTTNSSATSCCGTLTPPVLSAPAPVVNTEMVEEELVRQLALALEKLAAAEPAPQPAFWPSWPASPFF